MRYSNYKAQFVGCCLGSGRKSRKIEGFMALMCAVLISACSQAAQESVVQTSDALQAIAIDSIVPLPRPGIYSFFAQADRFQDRHIAVVANHTSLIDGVHLVDSLLGRGLVITTIFAPEHGFRGNMADGATVQDQRDARTGLPIISLYGKNKKPRAAQLAGVNLVIFDIQDVGARFYTYLSTLHYVMEACAEVGIPLLVLDRPNPNIHYVDGPVLDMKFSSFVGMHPVPVVYGMSIGEYAQMVNGEGWLAGGLKVELEVIPCQNYKRNMHYTLPVSPSPNLPNMAAVYLYPSLCFFEGTNVSVGRGTDRPFAMIGEPGNSMGSHEFTPRAIPGVSDHPPHKGLVCRGYDLQPRIDVQAPIDSLNLHWLVQMHRETKNADQFFLASGFFHRLAGTDALQKAIQSGRTATDIRRSWRDDLEAFRQMRAPYLIYE